MDSAEIRRRFLEFFSARGGPASGGGHKIVPSSSLVPTDPSVLLTTAGMQQFKPYFIGQADPLKDFGSKNTASVQKCFRTSDLDAVGDESHLTFFEMLGHFSFGGYFKKETIEWTYELLTTVFGIGRDRISASVFAGDVSIPFDQESYEVWLHLLPPEKIKKGNREGNIWGPAGPEGPCGAANEVYVDNLEIATLVFMKYYCAKDGSFSLLAQKGVDVGWGLERLAMAVRNTPTIFETDLFLPIVSLLPETLERRKKRILADHVRAVAFLISDGVRSSNKDAGYVLRRLLRRMIVYGPDFDFRQLFSVVVQNYHDFYSELNLNLVVREFEQEAALFKKTLTLGLRELDKTPSLDAKSAFYLYETYGLPFEVLKEKTPALSREAFDEEFKKHQEVSRAGLEKRFTGGLADYGPATIKLHTAHHLLLAALKQVLGPQVKQRGSNITAERLRLDFSHHAKLTDEEKKRIEELVNQKIKEDLMIVQREMTREEAEKLGAEMEFGQKYGERVVVYFIEDKEGNVFSKEFCGGPHVTHTGELGRFKIVKEEAVAAGLRRLKAVLE